MIKIVKIPTRKEQILEYGFENIIDGLISRRVNI